MKATPDLTLMGSVTYLKSKVQKNPAAPGNVNVFGELDSFVGDKLPYTPKFSASAGIEYRPEMFGGHPFVGVNLNYRSSQDAALGGSRLLWGTDPSILLSHAPGLDRVFFIKSYALVDARAGYEAEGGAWRVMVWGKNILNKNYTAAVIPFKDGAAVMTGMPVTYGLTIGFKI